MEFSSLEEIGGSFFFFFLTAKGNDNWREWKMLQRKERREMLLVYFSLNFIE